MAGLLIDSGIASTIRSISQDTVDVSIAIGREDSDTTLYWLTRIEKNAKWARKLIEERKL